LRCDDNVENSSTSEEPTTLTNKNQFEEEKVIVKV
jgi:hypothetical protein